jgi:SAM-dependent methyltransferase
VTIQTKVPVDWYRTSFSSNVGALYFEHSGRDKALLALEMLQLDGYERILDLACASGERTLELCRQGFDVIGVDPRGDLLEIAGYGAEQQDLWPYFFEEDPRDMEFDREFDLVLSLGGGTFEHFDYDEENLRAFRGAARALRPGGRLLMQVPNVLYVEAHLPERTWIESGEVIELVEQHWNAPTKRLDGVRRSIIEKDLWDFDPTPFQRRLCTIEELAEIFGSVGLRLADVFDEQGRPCAPSDVQQEIYVEARA